VVAELPVDDVNEIQNPQSEILIGDEFEVEKVQAAQVGSIQTVERTIKTKRHWRPRSFALDFAPGEAVAVTRRLYLSGESEYLLNGKTCRLRDIQDLFAGTGLSGAHYAIIEQGRIGQILSAKPSDRRNLIEEAAGISKFRTRQRAAETATRLSSHESRSHLRYRFGDREAGELASSSGFEDAAIHSSSRGIPGPASAALCRRRQTSFISDRRLSRKVLPKRSTSNRSSPKK
jgi:hypothetical protein